jgi:hypothetical protein
MVLIKLKKIVINFHITLNIYLTKININKIKIKMKGYIDPLTGGLVFKNKEKEEE